MEKRIVYRLAISILTLILVLILGQKGLPFLAAMAFEPIIFKKRELDEREIQLLYKAGNKASQIFFVSIFISAYLPLLLNYEINITKEVLVIFCIMIGLSFSIINSTTQLIILKKG